MYKGFFKRFVDIVVSAIALLLLSPVFIFVVIALTVANRGTPFFVQYRPGLNTKGFNIIKFKTMNDKKDDFGELLFDSQRITPVGSILRKTSLDELPQLINVFMGHMSLVGPRPLLFKYIPLYQKSQIRRHEVRPGITGWAQVNGRNAISWTNRFTLDIWYVDNVSLLTDIKILYMTLVNVFNGKDTEHVLLEGERGFDGFN